MIIILLRENELRFFDIQCYEKPMLQSDFVSDCIRIRDTEEIIFPFTLFRIGLQFILLEWLRALTNTVLIQFPSF